MSRILLLGASGQVGGALVRSAPPSDTVIAPTSAQLDLSRADDLRAFVRDTAPDLVINCAAFTRVDDAETELDAAHALNAEAPRILAEEVVALRARLIHVSTDYVFDGATGAPYRIDSNTNPINAYGATKRAGEVAILASGANASIVRTAWVHSGGGVNFIATAVRVLSRGNIMRVVDDQVSTPTRAEHVASALWALAQKPNLRGVLHYTDGGVASWFDVANCVLETLQSRGAAANGAAVVPVDSTAFPRPAKRPPVSLLDKHSSWNALGVTPQHWRVGVVASTHELLDA